MNQVKKFALIYKVKLPKIFYDCNKIKPGKQLYPLSLQRNSVCRFYIIFSNFHSLIIVVKKLFKGHKNLLFSTP